MIRTIPRGWAVALVVFAVVGLGALLVMTARFGGPAIRTSDPYRLVVSVPDSAGLSVRSDVLFRGVPVGRVESVTTEGNRAKLTLALDAEPVTVRRGATIRVGSKTLLGEAYVDLAPGPRGAPALSSGTRLPATAVRDTVDVGEALRTFGPQTRASMRDVLREAARGAADPATAERVSDTVAELRGATAQLRELSRLLDGRDDDIATTVEAGRRVVGELAARDEALRGLVRSGDRLLGAVARRDEALRATMTELPGVLTEARATLSTAQPLLREARPLVADARAAAPPLASALRRLPGTARDLEATLDGAAAVRRQALPVLQGLDPVITAGRPAARRLGPALRNFVPMLRFLAERRETISAWFANTADLGMQGDAKGSWARFFIFAEPGSATGTPSQLPGNSYTRPGDAANNQPYKPGDYERLTPTPVPPKP